MNQPLLDYETPRPVATGNGAVALVPLVCVVIPIFGFLVDSEVLFFLGMPLSVIGLIASLFGLLRSLIIRTTATRAATWALSAVTNGVMMAYFRWLFYAGYS